MFLRTGRRKLQDRPDFRCGFLPEAGRQLRFISARRICAYGWNRSFIVFRVRSGSGARNRTNVHGGREEAADLRGFRV